MSNSLNTSRGHMSNAGRDSEGPSSLSTTAPGHVWLNREEQWRKNSDTCWLKRKNSWFVFSSYPCTGSFRSTSSSSLTRLKPVFISTSEGTNPAVVSTLASSRTCT
jgi:hypothetical protein